MFPFFALGIISFVILANIDLDIIYQGFVMVAIILFGFIGIKRNWKEIQSEDLIIAVLDKQGIRVRGKEKIMWKNVEIVYITTEANFLTSVEQYLVFELLNKKEPIKIGINQTVGAVIIITLIEAYREKCNS